MLNRNSLRSLLSLLSIHQFFRPPPHPLLSTFLLPSNLSRFIIFVILLAPSKSGHFRSYNRQGNIASYGISTFCLNECLKFLFNVLEFRFIYFSGFPKRYPFFNLNQKAHADSPLCNCSKYFPSDHDFESSREVDTKFSKLNFNPNTHAVSLPPFCEFVSIVSLTFSLFHFTRHDMTSTRAQQDIGYLVLNSVTHG